MDFPKKMNLHIYVDLLEANHKITKSGEIEDHYGLLGHQIVCNPKVFKCTFCSPDDFSQPTVTTKPEPSKSHGISHGNNVAENLSTSPIYLK